MKPGVVRSTTGNDHANQLEPAHSQERLTAWKMWPARAGLGTDRAGQMERVGRPRREATVAGRLGGLGAAGRLQLSKMLATVRRLHLFENDNDEDKRRVDLSRISEESLVLAETGGQSCWLSKGFGLEQVESLVQSVTVGCWLPGAERVARKGTRSLHKACWWC